MCVCVGVVCYIIEQKIPKQSPHRDVCWVFGRSLGTWDNESRGEAWARDVCLGSSRYFIVKLKIREALVI